MGIESLSMVELITGLVLCLIVLVSIWHLFPDPDTEKDVERETDGAWKVPEPDTRTTLTYETGHTEAVDIVHVGEPLEDGSVLIEVRPAKRPGKTVTHRFNTEGKIVEMNVAVSIRDR